MHHIKRSLKDYKNSTIQNITHVASQNYTSQRHGGMLQAGVKQTVLNCNDFKTKVAKCRDPPMNARSLLVEAMATLPLMYGCMAAWCGHAAMTFSTPGASIDRAEACIRGAHFLRGLRAMSW